MFTSYTDFEIDIQRRTGAVYPLAVRSPGGEANGTLRIPTGDPAYAQLAARLATLDTDENMLARLGRFLFDALFQGQIKTIYARSQGMLEGQQGLRIKLCIDPAEVEVAALPWELLRDPDQAGPLALLDAPVVRYIPLPTSLPTLKTHLPLRVLLTGAQSTPSPAIEHELSEIRAALAALGEYVRITFEPHLTATVLQRRLREGFDVWHFVGQGGFGADGTTGQLLLEGAGGIDPISAPELGILLNRSGVRLALLDTGAGARLAGDPFRSLAPALVRAQVAAVVAMQGSAHAEVTRVFAKNFYQALAEGFPIDTCLTEGRKGLMNAIGLGSAEWSIPVIYTHAPDGVLFDLPAPVAPTTRDTIVTTASPGGTVAAAVGVHALAGTLLAAPPPLAVTRIAEVPAPPRRQRNFLDREHEQQQLQGELQPGGGAWLYGPRGCGLSALLNQVAASPAARTLPDGVAWVAGEIEPPHLDDIVQRLFSRFYTTSVTTRIDARTAQTYLGNLKTLFVLDRLPLNRADLLRLAGEILPGGTVLVAAEGEAPNTLLDLSLHGLPRAEAIKLCAGEAQIDAGQAEHAAALARLCALLDDLPLPLLLVARLIRAGAATAAQLAAVLEERVSKEATPQNGARPQDSAGVALARAAQLSLQALGRHERDLLAAVVVARPDVSLEQLTEVSTLPAPRVEAMLERLAGLGLIVHNAGRYAIVSASLRHVLEQMLASEPARRAAAAFLAGAVPLHAGDPGWLWRERGNIAEAIRTLLAEGQAAQAGVLAKAIQPALVVRGQWGAWGDLIDWAAEAARRSGDRALEAWALHERGTRAGLLGDRTAAQHALDQALRLRRQLGDQIGAAATRRNLSYLDLVPPVPPGGTWRERLRRHQRIILAGTVGALLAVAGLSIALSGLVPPGGIVTEPTPTPPIATVRPANQPPIANNDPAETAEDRPIEIDVTANDTDIETGRLVIAQLDPASEHGGALVVAGGRVLYTPPPNFSGIDRFQYSAGDEDGGRASATVTVRVRPVNDPPSFTKGPDQSVPADAGPQEVAWARDITPGPPGEATQALTFTATSSNPDLFAALPAIDPTGRLTYAPAPGRSGAASITVMLRDDGGMAEGGLDSAPAQTFTITIAPGNRPPVATEDTLRGGAGRPLPIPIATLLRNDRDPDGDPLAVRAVDAESTQGGTASLSGDTITYTPAPGFIGEDTFTYTIEDGRGGNAQSTVTVTVMENQIPKGGDDSRITVEDEPVPIPLADLTANDQDPDGDPLIITAAGPTSAYSGTVTLSGDQIIYTPAQDFNGQDTFAYTVEDGRGGSAQAVVTVRIQPVNDPPEATDDQASAEVGNVLRLPAAELIANDRDVDGDQLVVTSVISESVRGGKVLLSRGIIVYTPPAAILAPFVGIDSFSYQVCDPSNACANATVQVNVGAGPAISGESATPDPFVGSSECRTDSRITIQTTVKVSAGTSVAVRYRYSAPGIPSTPWRSVPMRASGREQYLATIDIGTELREELKTEYTLFEYQVVVTNPAGAEISGKMQAVAILWNVIC